MENKIVSVFEVYPPYDKLDKEVVDKARAFLEAAGVDCTKVHTQLTPHRLTHYLQFLLGNGEEPHLTAFPNEDPRVTGMVTVPDITFWSACSHHTLPFFGAIRIAYIPDEKVVGLSKLALIARDFARGFWMQEQLAETIADFLEASFAPMGLGVQICAQHTCQLLDVQNPPIPTMMYSVLRGAFMDEGPVRDEWLAYISSAR